MDYKDARNKLAAIATEASAQEIGWIQNWIGLITDLGEGAFFIVRHEAEVQADGLKVEAEREEHSHTRERWSRPTSRETVEAQDRSVASLRRRESTYRSIVDLFPAPPPPAPKPEPEPPPPPPPAPKPTVKPGHRISIDPGGSLSTRRKRRPNPHSESTRGPWKFSS